MQMTMVDRNSGVARATPAQEAEDASDISALIARLTAEVNQIA